MKRGPGLRRPIQSRAGPLQWGRSLPPHLRKGHNKPDVHQAEATHKVLVDDADDDALVVLLEDAEEDEDDDCC